jgi:hypothetical protein
LTGALLGLLALGAAAIFQVQALTHTSSNADGSAIMAILCFLAGVPLTLLAVVIALVRAGRNRQWRWFVAILLGTALLPLLPLTLVSSAQYQGLLAGLDTTLGEWLGALSVALGLVIVPLLVAAYAWASAGRRATNAPSQDASHGES